MTLVPMFLYKGHLELFQEDQKHSTNVRALMKFLAFPCVGLEAALFILEYEETEIYAIYLKLINYKLVHSKAKDT